MLWFVIALLCLLALAFCLPWRRRGRAPEAASVAANVDLYRRYEEELDADAGLNAEERAALLADRARTLLNDSEQAPAAPATLAPPLPRLLVPGLAATAVGLALLTYLQIGTPAAPQLVGVADVLRLDPALTSDARQLRERLALLETRTAAAPEEAESWYLLGVGRLKTGAYAGASSAFARAHELVGPDPSLDLFWLQARFLADGGLVGPASQPVVERVLERDPNQPLALELLAMTALRAGQPAQAIGFINRALSGALPPARRNALMAGLRQARSELTATPAVDVSLDLKAPPPAAATLFVIARPVGGGMPFAVVRRPVAGIPETVRLDDAVSMNPAAPLSSATEVEVVARLSLTGSVRAGPGDWEWRSGPVQPADRPVPALTAILAPPS